MVYRVNSSFMMVYRVDSSLIIHLSLIKKHGQFKVGFLTKIILHDANTPPPPFLPLTRKKNPIGFLCIILHQ